MNNERQEALNSLALMGLKSIKQDTSTHHSNQTETNKLIGNLHIQTEKLETKLDQSLQQMNLAITNLVNSQLQINNKLDNISTKLDTLSNKIEKLWGERWLYRILPFTLLSFIALACWQIISNWDSIASFFGAMNTFFQSNNPPSP